MTQLLGNMRLNPLSDTLVQSLLQLVRDNLLAVRKAAAFTEGGDATLLPLTMQVEEEMLNAEKLYAGRVRMAMEHANLA